VPTGTALELFLTVAVGCTLIAVVGRLARREITAFRCPSCGRPTSRAYAMCRHCGSPVS
jgi:predicted RNA-binding Zn-ribbon protein involved in translation (DUF1610 family)